MRAPIVLSLMLHVAIFGFVSYWLLDPAHQRQAEPEIPVEIVMLEQAEEALDPVEAATTEPEPEAVEDSLVPPPEPEPEPEIAEAAVAEQALEPEPELEVADEQTPEPEPEPAEEPEFAEEPAPEPEIAEEPALSPVPEVAEEPAAEPIETLETIERAAAPEAEEPPQVDTPPTLQPAPPRPGRRPIDRAAELEEPPEPPAVEETVQAEAPPEPEPEPVEATSTPTVRSGSATPNSLLANLAALADEEAQAKAKPELWQVIRAVRAQIKRCWLLNPAESGNPQLSVEIAVAFDRGGTLRKAEVLEVARMVQDDDFRDFAVSAHRALSACSPFDLPADHYDIWQKFTMRFVPSEPS